MQPKSKKLLSKLSFLSLLLFAAYGFFAWWARHNITICVPRGDIRIVKLPDSSEVTLNSESSLSYNAWRWAKKREVVLTGEAFFKIRFGKPFSVKTDLATVKTFGAKFNFRLRDRKAKVSCLSGQVNVAKAEEPSEDLVLEAGLATSVVAGKTPLTAYHFEQSEVTSWTAGEMKFTNTPLIDVLAEMERQFAIRLRPRKDLVNLSFTGRIKNSDVTYALDFVSLACGLKYDAVNDSTYVLY